MNGNPNLAPQRSTIDDPTAALHRVHAWENATSWPLAVGALLLLGLSTWFLAADTPAPALTPVLAAVIVLLWLAFVADYLIRLSLAGGARGLFVRSRWLDLASLVVPLLRPFLIVVYVWRVPFFRRNSGARQRARFMTSMMLFSLLYVYAVSWGVWLVERDAEGSDIRSFGDALFWGFTTISTVGYGDLVPVTFAGRVLAVGLMMGGIVIIGVTSATVISALNERIKGSAA